MRAGKEKEQKKKEEQEGGMESKRKNFCREPETLANSHREATCRRFCVQPALNLSGLFLKDAPCLGQRVLFSICVEGKEQPLTGSCSEELSISSTAQLGPLFRWDQTLSTGEL